MARRRSQPSLGSIMRSRYSRDQLNQMANQYYAQHHSNQQMGSLMQRNQRLWNAVRPSGNFQPSPQHTNTWQGQVTHTPAPTQMNKYTSPKKAQAQQYNKYAAGQVGKMVNQLMKSHGLSEDDARHAIMRELLNTGKNESKTIDYSTSFPNAMTGGKYKADAKVQDPFTILKNSKNKKDTIAKFQAASFLQSPQGKAAMQSGDPAVQMQAFKSQYTQQVVQEAQQVAGPGGLADTYDQYQAELGRAQGMTAKQLHAAFGVESITEFKSTFDPFNADNPNGSGMTASQARKYFSIDPLTPFTGQSIKAAMARRMDAERMAISTGRPVPYSHLGDVLKQLSLTPDGKQLANVYKNLKIPGNLQSVFGLAGEYQASLANPQFATGGETLDQILNATNKPPKNTGTAVPLPPAPKGS